MSTSAPYRLRRAGPTDADMIEGFLSRHPASSMFLRSNLAAHGTVNDTHPHGTTFYVPDTTGPVRAVFAITNDGVLMAQAPDAPESAWVGFCDILNGREVTGMTGLPDQVAGCVRACGLTAGPWAVLADEPLYELKLADLLDLKGVVRKPGIADLAVLESWYATYELETGQVLSRSGPSTHARARAARAIDSDDVILLEDGGIPCAMAGINARLPDIVQVGGVFTPDGQRGKGYARRAVAGLLRLCAAQGVTRAVLFANNEAAAKAYEALKFRHVGEYRVALLNEARTIGAHK